jgi:hypothetical protein
MKDFCSKNMVVSHVRQWVVILRSNARENAGEE